MFGLVLEGGGTKGAYHIGAYKALCELGVDIGCIVGSSIGAVNGALFVQGDFETADSVWSDISASDIICLPEGIAETENIFDIKNSQAFYKEIKLKKGLDITPFEKLLRNVINEDKVRKSCMDFGLATFNVTGKKEEQMFIKDIPNGELVDYIIASASFPVFQPKKIKKSVFVDGGLTNNMPVDMMIKSGYKDIICIEVGGVGFSKWISGAGCNIISVKSGKGSVKTLDFNKQLISEAKQMGYFDTLRTFGKVGGKKYYFNIYDYTASKLKYSERIVNGIEYAAEIFGIDKLKIYTVEKLSTLVVQAYRNTEKCGSVLEVFKKTDCEKVSALADAMLRSDSEMLEKGMVAGLLGTMFEAASAIAYFSERI